MGYVAGKLVNALDVAGGIADVASGRDDIDRCRREQAVDMMSLASLEFNEAENDRFVPAPAVTGQASRAASSANP